MATRLKKTKFNGVFYIDSAKRKFQGKPDRCFYLRYWLNGKQFLKKIGYTSEGYTAQYVASKKSEYMGTSIDTEDKTFQDLYDEFIKWAEVNKKSYKDDIQRYNTHIKERLGTMKVADIKTNDINNLLLDIRRSKRPNGREYAPQTIKHILLVIKRIFNFNIKNSNCTVNPASNVQLERFDNTRISYLTDDEIERMFAYLDSGAEWVYDSAFIKFAFYTGLRRSEIINLTWNNVDINNSVVFLFDTKGKKNQRIILTDNAVSILKSLERIDDYVFPSKKGGKRDDLKKLWKRIKKESNIRESIRLHDIRHTFGTIASSTLPVKIVQQMMTHKDIKTTLRYAHIRDKEMKDAVSNLGNLFSSITDKNNK